MSRYPYAKADIGNGQSRAKMRIWERHRAGCGKEDEKSICFILEIGGKVGGVRLQYCSGEMHGTTYVDGKLEPLPRHPMLGIALRMFKTVNAQRREMVSKGQWRSVYPAPPVKVASVAPVVDAPKQKVAAGPAPPGGIEAVDDPEPKKRKLRRTKGKYKKR